MAQVVLGHHWVRGATWTGGPEGWWTDRGLVPLSGPSAEVTRIWGLKQDLGHCRQHCDISPPLAPERDMKIRQKGLKKV